MPQYVELLAVKPGGLSSIPGTDMVEGGDQLPQVSHVNHGMCIAHAHVRACTPVHTHTHTHLFIYIYLFVCVCVHARKCL